MIALEYSRNASRLGLEEPASLVCGGKDQET